VSPLAVSERQRDLLGTLGHELRNPLAAVVAGVSVVAEMTDPDDPRAAFLQRALRDLARIGALLEGCLQLGTDRDVARADVGLASLARCVAQRYPTGFVALQASAVAVRGDAALLERVLENLIDNARAAGASAVSVFVGEEDGRAVIHVGDDGPGVPAAIAERIFEPFVSGCGGTGLGLAVVERIVRAHGGSIALLGSPRGALFRIVLPRP
jgi:signal transduction histidine kinase